MDKEIPLEPVIWHVDEMFLHAMKKFWYFFVVIDGKSKVLGWCLSPRRDTRGAVSALRMAKQNAQREPDFVVTDGLRGYPRALRKVFGIPTRAGYMHVVAHFKPQLVRHKNFLISITNNRIESWNSHFRSRYSRMRGFKNPDSMNKFVANYAAFWNSKFFCFAIN